MSRYRLWLADVLLWDGLLPAALLLIPLVVRGLFPRQAVVEASAAVFVPIFAFFARAGVGAERLRTGGQRPWQFGCFMLALFSLLIFDALLIHFGIVGPKAIQERWPVLAGAYLFYLALIATAFLPRGGRAQNVPDGFARLNPAE